MAKKAKKSRTPRGCSVGSTKLTSIGYKGARCGCVVPGKGWRFKKNSACNANASTPKGPATSRAGWAWLSRNSTKKGSIKMGSRKRIKYAKR